MPTKARQILDLHTNNPSLTQDEIAEKVSCAPSTVSKTLGKLEDEEISSEISFHLRPPKETPVGAEKEYQCGGCNYAFTATDKPSACPECKVDFQ